MTKLQPRRAESPLHRAVRTLERLRWPVVAAWIVLLGLAGAGALGLADRLSGGGWYAADSQSSHAVEATRDGFVGRGRTTLTLVITDHRYVAPSADFERRVGVAYGYVTGLDGLRVESAYGWGPADTAARQSFVGDDHRTTVTTLGLDLADGDARRELPQIQQTIDDRFAEDGLQVALVGPATVWGEINVLSEHGLIRAELVALPLLLAVMLWIYRGWVAAGLSLLVAVTSVVWTLGLLSIVAAHVELSIFVQNAATMLGLGVAVDYSLFLISRYREQLLRGESPTTALTSALHTAGHTVLGSGLTVVLAMSTLFIVDLPVIRSLALGAVVVVSVAMVVNLVVLPAMLAVVGRRLVRPGAKRATGRDDPSAPADTTSRGWHRWAHAVMTRPLTALALGVAVLCGLALPATGLSTFTPDARIVPAEATVRSGWDAVRAAFGDGAASPLTVVVRTDGPVVDHPDADRVVSLSERLDRLPHTVRVTSADTLLRSSGVQTAAQIEAALRPGARDQLPTGLADAVGHFLSADGSTMVIEVVADDTASSPVARELLDQVRTEAAALAGPGIDVVVGGETAEGVDGNQAIVDGLPWVAAAMLGVIYTLLLLIFGSVLLPLKAIILNVVSVAATYGVVVLVFQRGLGADLLGFEATGQVTNFVPILLLTLLFSLSTDYEVFLLSRVREEHRSGAGNAESVARGLALTAPLISGAALLMVTVFAAFTLAGVLPVQELGLGMAFAIIVDATLVRLVLVPASMKLMGAANWWRPRRRTTTRRRVEGPRRAAVAATPRRATTPA